MGQSVAGCPPQPLVHLIASFSVNLLKKEDILLLLGHSIGHQQLLLLISPFTDVQRCHPDSIHMRKNIGGQLCDQLCEKSQKFVIIILVLFLNSFHSAPSSCCCCCFLSIFLRNVTFFQTKTFSFIKDVDANNLL